MPTPNAHTTAAAAAALALLAVGASLACAPRASSAQDTAPPAKAKASATAPCDVATKGLEACAGAHTRVQGTLAVMVMQHPMLNAPAALDQPAVQQSYLDAHGSQLVLLHADPLPACEGPLVVEGALSRVDLGGATGKNSYRGWSLRVAKASCG